MENTAAGSGLNATRNGLKDSSSRVRVFARVKPLTGRDAGAVSGVRVCEAASAVRVLTEPGVPLDGSASGSFNRESAQAQEFIFDGVFPPDSTQVDIFDEVGLPILREVLRGFNGTIFAYGQTGSGKTHSLLNTGGMEAGLMPRICAKLFEMAVQDPTSDYSVEAAAVQVYNEQVDDLLHPQHKSGTGHNLNITNGGEVPGLTWVSCHRQEQLLSAFTRARTNLVYAETKMNKASSRSHAVFQMRITRRSEAETTCSVLNIVDLAGSERVKKSGAEGVQFREATAINKSLLALGNVVNALASRKSHVPFRDSKLTHVLAPAIGGNCKTSLLVCASPAQEHAGETLCSLEFASRAMNIQVDARVNRLVSIDIKGLLTELKAVPEKEERIDQAQVLREELARSRQTVVDVESRAEHAEGRATIAEQRLQEALARAQRAEERAAATDRANGTSRDKVGNNSVAEAALLERAEFERQIAALRAELLEKQTCLELSGKEAEKWRMMYNMNELQVVRLEAKLVQRGEVLQLRNAALCKAMDALEQLQGVMDSREEEVQRALDEKQATGAKLQQVSTLESELREARTELIAKSAEASFEQIRAQNEADRLAHTRTREQERMDARREQMFKEIDDEKWELGLKQEALKEQERELQQRIAQVENLEREKKELARQRKELEKERQDMQLRERRAHNGAVGKGPPARSPSISKMLQAPPSLERTASPSSEAPGGKLPPFGYRGPAVAVAASVQASEGSTAMSRRSSSVTTMRSPATPAAARSRTPTPTRNWRSHSKS